MHSRNVVCLRRRAPRQHRRYVAAPNSRTIVRVCRRTSLVVISPRIIGPLRQALLPQRPRSPLPAFYSGGNKRGVEHLRERRAHLLSQLAWRRRPLRPATRLGMPGIHFCAPRRRSWRAPSLLMLADRSLQLPPGTRQSRHHRPDGNTRHPRDLLVREPLHLAQDERLAKLDRQRLDRFVEKPPLSGAQQEYLGRLGASIRIGGIRMQLLVELGTELTRAVLLQELICAV